MDYASPLTASVRDLEATKQEVARVERDLVHRFSHLPAGAVLVYSRRLIDAIRAEFMQGVDKNGETHNKTGRTLKTLKLRYAFTWATITISGGAAYVEYRQPPHWIEAKRPGGALHWTDLGGDYFAKKVFHPGYGGDDFIGRAIKRANHDNILGQHDIEVEYSGMGSWQGPTLPPS